MSKGWGNCEFKGLEELQKKLDKALNGDTIDYYEKS